MPLPGSVFFNDDRQAVCGAKPVRIVVDFAAVCSNTLRCSQVVLCGAAPVKSRQEGPFGKAVARAWAIGANIHNPKRPCCLLFTGFRRIFEKKWGRF